MADYTEDDVLRLAETLVEIERAGVVPGSRTYARRILNAGYRLAPEGGLCPATVETEALPADEHHYDVPCADRPYCRIPEHHEAGVLALPIGGER